MKKIIYILVFICISANAQKIQTIDLGKIDLGNEIKKLQKNLQQINLRLDALEALDLNNETPEVEQELKAFPGAEGYGKYATGGRGGVVIKVTNKNNSGYGSLRAALEDTRTRTIIFEVGGTINLSNHIYVKKGNFTLAGQTSLGGILIKGASIQLECSNAIIRYISIRPGSSAPSSSDGLNVTAWGGKHHKNIIIDHVSLSWAKDESFDLRAVGSGTIDSVTIQNSIVSETSKGVLAGQRTFNKTYFKNLFAHNSERNIRTNYPTNNTFDFEMINNLIYGFRYSTQPSLGSKFTVRNNKYKKSSQTSISSGAMVEGSNSGQGTVNQTHAYLSGNIIPNGKLLNNSALKNYIKSSPYASSGIIPIAASEIENNILDHVGNSFPKRDLVDLRIINQYNNSNGITTSSGFYPSISTTEKLLDSDNDGMLDAYEDANNLNKNDPSDRNLTDTIGYTMLEKYLNGLVK